MINAEAEFKVNNTQRIKSLIDNSIPKALEACGIACEGNAKLICPVDTGRLRNSITHEQKGKTVRIGTNVEYASFVELGTSKRKEKPYLRPSLIDHKNEYLNIFEAMIKM